MLRTINIRGPVRGYTGYDNTVRSFLRALDRIGARAGVLDFPDWSATRLADSNIKLQADILHAPVDGVPLIQFCMPPQVLELPNLRSINFTMFELDRVPRFWVDHSLRHDHVIVPQQASMRSWLAEGFPPDRISICPLGVDSERFRLGNEPLAMPAVRGRPVSDYSTRILNVSAVIPRKNLLGLLLVWLEATSPYDDAVLILKLNYTDVAAMRLMRDLALMERETGHRRDDAAGLLFFDDVLSDSQVPELYAAATHYWSMSRGEGWDQPMTEAAASGLRLIAPDHTAYRTYLDEHVATLLPCHAMPASRLDLDEPDPSTYRSLFSTSPFWCEPDFEAACAAIRAAIEQRDAPDQCARDRLLPFSWENAAKRLLSIATEHGRP